MLNLLKQVQNYTALITFFSENWGVWAKTWHRCLLYARDFNCFQNWLCIIIFNWIFKNLWDFDQKLQNFDIFFTSTFSVNGYGQFTEFWSLRVGFGSLGIDFELLGVNVGHLGVNFRLLEVDFRLHCKIWATRIRF